MKEILGAELDLAFKELGIPATKTYEVEKLHYEYQEKFQVWEMSDEDYERICNMGDAGWKEDWGWWRGAEGSNLGFVHRRYNINGHYIIAWDGRHADWEKENKTLKPDDRWPMERKYDYLTQYYCDEIGASTDRNITALSVDLARQNNMKMSELFRRFQGRIKTLYMNAPSVVRKLSLI